MKFALFLLTFLYFAHNTSESAKQVCTTAFGYQEKFSTCWRPGPTSLQGLNFANADELCRTLNGATLVSDGSLKENVGLQNYLADLLYRQIRIGLTCNSTKFKDCVWTHQRGKLGFDVFEKGSPSAKTGNCVIYNVKDATWASRDCNQSTQFICEMPATTQDDCDNNYDYHCYTVITQTPQSFPDAQKECEKSCSNLVSVHSELENRYVALFSQDAGVTSLGGIAPSKKSILWSDNSIQVYNNLQNYDQGYCVFMRTSTPDGTWFSGNCSTKAPFVCKRPTGVKCNDN